MRRFGLIGAAGYIAPRHMEAIYRSGNSLIAALDPHDSVGIIDQYFPEAQFFTEFERFDRHLDKLRRDGSPLDFLSICSPNYLHDAHCRFALRNNIDAICEKPLVLNPWNVDALIELEQKTGKKIHNILQLRHHPSIVKLKQEIEKVKDKYFHVDLAYLTPRGSWYSSSWKGNQEKSGGIATNIGIHFFDMLCWLFGEMQVNEVHILKDNLAAGMIQFERAQVKWVLSTEDIFIPEAQKSKEIKSYRSMRIDDEEIDFSNGFEDLHYQCYQHILNEDGFGTEEVKPSIELVSDIRNSNAIGITKNSHQLVLQ